MKSMISLEEISDGKVYDIKDMVKADSGGCEGCSSCCHGIGDLVELTPFDIYEITRSLNVSFDSILNDKVEIKLNNKIALPHLKVHGNTERCGFLNKENRCSIHSHRPNICRLFPLGRVYEDNDFKYFLQVGACVKPVLGKVKVKKWIGIENYNQNKEFLLQWYNLLKALKFRVKFIRNDEELRVLNEYFIQTFYRMNIKDGSDFYTEFNSLLPEAKSKLGII